MKSGTELAFDLLAVSGTSLGEIRVRQSDVTVPAGPVLHGIDVHGLRHLLIPLSAGQDPLDDRQSAGVQIRVRPLIEAGTKVRYLDVVCLFPHLDNLFSIVADEMLLSANGTPDNAPRACLKVLNRWRELLERPAQSLLGPERVAALLAELTWLERVARVNAPRALSVWRGPLNDRHDLIGASCAVEVKSTIAREGRLTEIHGDRQLESDPDVLLYLAFHRYERSQEAGVAVPEIVTSLLDLGVDRLHLLSLLAKVGYDERDVDVYRQMRFKETEFRTYLVTEGFPRIVPDSFSTGSVPERVLMLRYTIDLEGEPPYPISQEAVDVVVNDLSASTR